MKQRFYPAVLERHANGYFGLWFADFPGAVAAGRTQEEVMAKGQDALGAAFQECAERSVPLPTPTPVEAIEIPADCDFVSYLAVGATPPDPSERVNVYLPKSLIERVDRAATAMGMTRSSLFGLAVTRLLNVYGESAATIVVPPKGHR
ncbi:MAG TPA: type II toxin-antitoxin system HicB family antitoxin [Caulobacteraceae bacterium]|nr:type II toxin-antitoxin system HicB family antitoxin [Caulobacteraceae bacterium]